MHKVKIWDYFDHLIYSIMNFLFVKILGQKYTEIQHEAFMQFVKFAIVGRSARNKTAKKSRRWWLPELPTDWRIPEAPCRLPASGLSGN